MYRPEKVGLECSRTTYLDITPTGLFIIIGTTFGGCTEPQSDLTKNLFNDYMKIIIKISYGY